MAVVIRLARFGTKHTPKYRITVADSRNYVKHKFIEVLGYFNPAPRGKDQGLIMDLPKVQEWIKKGAQPSDRVRSLIREMEKNPAPKA